MSVRTVDTPPDILVVDDVAANRLLLEEHLLRLGYAVRQAADGLEALAAVEAQEPDLVLLDVNMPKLDGLSVCRRLKADPRRRLVPIVIITATQDRSIRLAGIEAGADDFLTKPFDARELMLRCRVLLRDRMLNKRLDAAESVILAFARTVEARDLYTVHHAERVGRVAAEIGQASGRCDVEPDVLYHGGVLHDLGKISIPDAILLKPGPLDAAEYEVMKRHSDAGDRILQPLRSAERYLPIVRHHHERVDGGGYPDHLRGTEIAVGARIAAIADAWDAMTSDRPYRAGLDREEARRRLHAGRGSQWDAEFVDVFVALLDDGTIDRVVASQYVAAYA
ncbi:MAG: cyclic di-GMP phosphodiesterase [Chloroflexota bacterium]|jgi:putative two-component system response regulator|nr:cyclic di-GMP phosphodiesterase [Chloroflexota bacterium]